MLASVLLLFLGLIATIVIGNNWLASKSRELHDQKLSLLLVDEQQLAVNRALKDIESYAEIEAIANSIVPKDKDQARSVREISALASSNGIPLASFSFPASSLGNAPAKKTTTDSDTTTSTTTSTTPSITQAVPVKGMTGVYQTLVTVRSDTANPVPYSSFISFLEAIEKNRRTAQIENIEITPTPGNANKLTFQLGINIFTKP